AAIRQDELTALGPGDDRPRGRAQAVDAREPDDEGGEAVGELPAEAHVADAGLLAAIDREAGREALVHALRPRLAGIDAVFCAVDPAGEVARRIGQADRRRALRADLA